MIISEGMCLIERIKSRIMQQRGAVTAASASALGGASTPLPLQTVGDKNLDEAKEPKEQLDFLFIDADSKDPSLGLSAPPLTFITASALKTFHKGYLFPQSSSVLFFLLIHTLPISLSRTHTHAHIHTRPFPLSISHATYLTASASTRGYVGP